MDLDALDFDNKNDFNFKPDVWFKRAIATTDNETIIRIINYLFKTNISYDVTVDFKNTEFSKINYVNNGEYIRRADVIIEDLVNKLKYHLEFQSSKDDTMALRLFMYGLYTAESDINDNKNYLKFPKSCVIYTIPPYEYNISGRYNNLGDYEREVAEGYKKLYLELNNVTIDSVTFDTKVIEIEYPFINLLFYDEISLLNSDLYLFSVMSFYKTLKTGKSLSNDEDALLLYNRIKDYYAKLPTSLSSENIKIIQDALYSMCVDFISLMRKSNVSKEVIDMYKEEEITLGMQLERKAEEKGRQEGRQEGRFSEKIDIVIKMHNTSASIEYISLITGLSGEQIEEILKNNGLI